MPVINYDFNVIYDSPDYTYDGYYVGRGREGRYSLLDFKERRRLSDKTPEEREWGIRSLT